MTTNPTAPTTSTDRAAPTSAATPSLDLRALVAGQVIDPSEDGYAAARQVFYGGFDRHPATIVRPTGAADVAAVVTYARDTGSELAVRSGGHSLAGHGTSDGGIVLDLSTLDGLELDVDGRTAWAGAGVTAGAYTAAAGVHGLATGFGDAPSVALGGLVTGGGMGFLSRAHGLTIDNLLAAEVVTADGEVHHVDDTHEPDLFWAIRGGGGNVGVVTRFQLRLHDVSETAGGMLVLPATAEVLAGLVAAADAAPDSVTVLANTMVAPPMPFLPAEVHGQFVVLVLALHVGPAAEADAALAPFRALATPLVDQLGPMPYTALFEEEGPAEEFHPTAITRTGFRDTFTVAEAQVALDALQASTAMMSVVQLRVLGGAVARVADDATAYAHRQRRILVNVAAMYVDPAERDRHAAWADQLFGRLREDGADGAYVNFLADDGPVRIREAYPGATWDRLVAIKRRYDPGNVFRLNHNVPPA